MCCLGIVPSVLNNLLYDDDEDYKDVRQEDKDLNYLFKVGNLGLKYRKIISGISATYNRLKNAKDGDDFAFDGYLQELNQAISPVENLRTIFSPFTDIKTNTTWYGGNIEGMKLPMLDQEIGMMSQLVGLLKVSDKQLIIHLKKSII